MRNYLFMVILIGLIAVALILGYFIVRPVKNQTNRVSDSNPNTVTEKKTNSASSGTSKFGEASAPSEGTEEQKALQFPGPNASETELKDFADLVNKLAQETQPLDVTNCTPNPLVLRLTQNSPLKVKNSDAVERVIQIKDWVTPIPPQSESEVAITSAIGGSGLGNYGYSCDGAGPRGIIQIVP